MERRHSIAVVAGALLLGAGAMGACTADVEEPRPGVVGGAHSAPGDVDAPPAELPADDMYVSVDAGAAPSGMDRRGDGMPGDSLPQARDDNAFDHCDHVTCAEGEVCCPATGSCYPAECRDCCDAVVGGLPEEAAAAVGTHEGPGCGRAFGGPEPPRVMPDSLPEPPEPKPNE